MGIRTFPQCNAIGRIGLGLALLWCGAYRECTSGSLGSVLFLGGAILLTWCLVSKLSPILRGNEGGGPSPYLSTSLLIGLLALTVSIAGWRSHAAHRYTADELCALRQSMAFETFSATLPLSTFDPHLDPTGACFARSKFGYFSVQAPGWAATLAGAKKIGVPHERLPWLVASLTLVVVGLIGVQLGGGLLGAMSIIALSHNQFFDEISRSYWSHSLTMLFTALGILLLVHLPTSKERNLSTHIFMVGVVSAAILLTRPLVGLSFIVGAAPTIAFSLPRPLSKETLRLALVFAAGPLLGVLLYGYFNLATTGSFFLSGYEYVHGPGHNPGFFHVAPNGIEHTPARAAMTIHHHVRLLLQFVIPSTWYFIAVLPVAFTIGWSPGLRSVVLVLLALWLGAGTYWDSSFFYGPRFYYESLIPLTLIIVSGYYAGTKALATALPGSPRIKQLIAGGLFVVVTVLMLPTPPVR